MNVLDSHQHFWRLSRGDYGWLTPDLTALYRDFEPQHLQPMLRSAGVMSTIVVQAAPTLAETRFLLGLAERHEFIAGVVGWVDLEDAQAPHVLAELANDPKFVGVRPMVQDLADPHWLATAKLDAATDVLVEHHRTFDALVRPQHLPALLQFCERHSELTIVIDHAAKPCIAENIFEPWASQLRALANFPNTRCKISGLVTEAGAASYEAIAPYVDHVLECFGAQRALWGSDWPVCELVCEYGDWFELSRRLLDRLTPTERAALFGDVARTTYGIGVSRAGGAHTHA